MATEKRKPSSLGDVIAQLLAQSANQNAMLQASSGTPSVDAINAQAASKDWSYGAGLMAQKVLRGLISNWAQNYQMRGDLKKDKQDKLTTLFNQKYGDQAGAVIQDLKDQGIWDRWNKLSKFDPESYNMPSSEPSLGAQHAARQAADKVAPIPGRQEQAQPWENVADKVLPLLGTSATGDSQLAQRALTEGALPLANKDDWVNNSFSFNPEDWLKMLGG